ncbi:hypothetical protein MMC17_007162 [Xylographa soralifera]|nr:hypothetical protein [Xylographa soralifera]
MATMSQPQHFMDTSGELDAVWIHKEPYSNRPHFSKLDKDIKVDVCIIGAGISGISTAYELVSRGLKVAMIEAREVLSGETGRTSGHLSSALDASYVDIAKKHGKDAAKNAASSHQWALKHVGEVSKQLGIECEYKVIPDYEISQYEKSHPKHEDDMKEIQEDLKMAKELGLAVSYRPDYAIKGWDGKVDQRDVGIYEEQATFHPTMYLVGLLKWLAKQPNFECYTRTRMLNIEEKGLLTTKEVQVSTLDGNTITCNDAVEATCIPLQKLSIVAQMEYFRTYCIAIRIPRGSYEDCLINDQADPYHYIRFTGCDDKDDYLVIGGGDHKVGQEEEDGRFAELESWVRGRYAQAGSVDYKWSGQVNDSVDLMHFIGLNQGKSHTYVITGDTGHGLTMGVLAGKLVADEIQGVENPWSSAYNPKRLPPLSSIPSMIAHDVQINMQYKRFVQSDIPDIESLAMGEGGVLNPKTKKPLAVYKDDQGKVHQFSALCPHLQGVVCWNKTEKSWDCPIHGSRFSKDGVQIMGPSKAGLSPADESGEAAQQQAMKA